MTINFLEIMHEIESKPKSYAIGGIGTTGFRVEDFEKMPRQEVEDQSTVICANNASGAAIAAFSNTDAPPINLQYSRKNQVIVAQIGNAVLHDDYKTHETTHITPLIKSFCECFDPREPQRFIHALYEKIMYLVDFAKFTGDNSLGEDIIVIYMYEGKVVQERLISVRFGKYEDSQYWTTGTSTVNPPRNGQLIYNKRLICTGNGAMEYNKNHQNDNITGATLEGLRKIVLDDREGEQVHWATMDPDGNIDANF